MANSGHKVAKGPRALKVEKMYGDQEGWFGTVTGGVQKDASGRTVKDIVGMNGPSTTPKKPTTANKARRPQPKVVAPKPKPPRPTVPAKAKTRKAL